jgi:hypothetical protein
LQHDFWGQGIRGDQSHKSYRPLTILSFRAIRSLSLSSLAQVTSPRCILLFSLRPLRRPLVSPGPPLTAVSLFAANPLCALLPRAHQYESMMSTHSHLPCIRSTPPFTHLLRWFWSSQTRSGPSPPPPYLSHGSHSFLRHSIKHQCALSKTSILLRAVMPYAFDLFCLYCLRLANENCILKTRNSI